MGKTLRVLPASLPLALSLVVSHTTTLFGAPSFQPHHHHLYLQPSPGKKIVGRSSLRKDAFYHPTAPAFVKSHPYLPHLTWKIGRLFLAGRKGWAYVENPSQKLKICPFREERLSRPSPLPRVSRIVCMRDTSYKRRRKNQTANRMHVFLSVVQGLQADVLNRSCFAACNGPPPSGLFSLSFRRVLFSVSKKRQQKK